MIIIFFMPILLITLGILIKYYKQYWLIAGYNTVSQKEKDKVDIEAAGNFIGNMLFVLAGINLSGLILRYLGYKMIGDLSWGLFIIAIIYLLFKSQHYYKKDEDGKTDLTNKYSLMVAGVVTVPVLILVLVLVLYGGRPTEVVMESNGINISGMYGTTVPKATITSIELLEEIPVVERKVNGYNFGNVQKGTYRLRDWGKGRIYLQSNKGPYIVIWKDGDEFFIINFKNSEETRRVYQLIIE